MATIKALALASIVHGEHNLTKNQPIDLPQGTYKDLEKAGHVEEFDEKKYKQLEVEREDRAERSIVNAHLAATDGDDLSAVPQSRSAGGHANKNAAKHQNQSRGSGGNANK